MNKRLSVSTAVIPVAGYGTRVLPFTKAMPKVMLPLVDKPSIQHIVEEAVKAGISRIVFITSNNQHVIEDHFDTYFELEERLRQSGKIELLKQLRKVSDLAEFIYVRQKEQLGNAHAILQAKSIVDQNPFVVQWGDGVVFGSKQPFLKQLMDVYDKQQETGCDAVLATHETDDDGTNKYAIVEVQKENNGQRVISIIEKPGPEGTSSRIASNMGYLLTPVVFDYINKLNPKTGSGGEYVLADALSAMVNDGRRVFAANIIGRHIDVGNKVEYAKGFCEMALSHPETKDAVARHLAKISKSNN